MSQEVPDFRVRVTVPGHRKTKRLIRRIGEAGAWKMVCFWAWVRTDRPDGDLSGLPDEEIELAIDWSGEPGAFVAAMAEVGFLDGEEGARSVHDWDDHNPYSVGSSARRDKAKLAGLISQYGEERGRAMFHAYQARSRPESDSESAARQLGDELGVNSESIKSTDLVNGESTTSQLGSQFGLTPPPSPLPLPKPNQKHSRSQAPPGYETKSGRMLTGKRLEQFEQFWSDFAYKSGRAEAADAWLDIEGFEQLLPAILAGAKREAAARPALIAAKRTPKMAQGWLTSRRWEDSPLPTAVSASGSPAADTGRAWQDLRNALRDQTIPEDAIVAKVARELGGLRALGGMTEFDVSRLRPQFDQLYRAQSTNGGGHERH